MGSYVALLRGINVGGNNIIPMKELAATFTAQRYTDVKTIIASGNVLFRAPARDPRALETSLEKALTKAHAYDARVVVRSKAEMVATIAALPAGWRRPRADTRYYVLFLRHEIDAPTVIDELEVNPDVDTLSYGAGAVFWSAPFAAIKRSRMNRITAHRVYKLLTIRNLNTTQKIAGLLEAYAD